MVKTVGMALTLAAVMAWSAPALTDAAVSSAEPTAAPLELPLAELPLAELPQLPSVEPGPATAEATQDLQTRRDQLFGTSVPDPLAELDMKFLVGDLDARIVPAIAARLAELREELDGRKAEQLLEKAREAGRRAIRKLKKPKKQEPDGDWLVFLLSDPKPDDPTWQETVELLGMLRMLEAVGTTPAVRQMVACHSYFGELVRVDLDRAFTKRMKDRAVPALIEAKQHDARKVRSWASKQLDALGRAIPGESVSMTDADVLTDVLYAFGRVRDVEATGVILSFTNSDRIQLRTAARAAIGALGEPAGWQLKDTYKSATGQSPPSEWDWKRVAQELFRLHDRARLATVFDLWEAGSKAASEKRFADATAAYDGVLARAPLFERRGEMAPAYLGHAEQLLAANKKADALVALRKAVRLGPTEGERKKIEARILVLEAEELIAKGTPDRFLIQRAIDLDPSNEEAKALLASLDEQKEQRQTVQRRYLGGIVAIVVGLVLAILLVRRRDPVPAKVEGRVNDGRGSGT